MITADEILSVAESLPSDLRIRLVDRLLNSLNSCEKDIDMLWADEAEKRVGELKTGKVKSSDGETVFKEIRERLAK